MGLTNGLIIFGAGVLLVAAGLVSMVIFFFTAGRKKRKIEEYLKEQY